MPSQKRPVSLLNFPNGDSSEIIGRVESIGKPINGYKNENK
jgi:hypothetical protein